MNPSRLFIERPIATTLLMVALFLVGAMSYRLLPVSALPEVDYPTIQVVTLYPGGSPDVIATTITAPLERQFGQMPGLMQMSSSSSGGASVITLQFALDLNLDVAEQEVQAAMNAAATLLPVDLPNPPVYSKVNPADAPILTLAVTSATLPATELVDLVDTRVSQKIAQVSGVGQVNLNGALKPAVRIQVNTVALAARGLTLEDIRTAVNAANVNQAKGELDSATRARIIDANDQLKSPDDYRRIVLGYQNGAALRLQDVARVSSAPENLRLGAWAGREPAVIINVQRQPGANVIAVAEEIKTLLPRLQSTLPESVHLRVLNDRTVTVQASVSEVRFELVLAIVLGVLVIFLFLRNGTATLIPAVAVPLSLVGTFAVMYLAGFSINNLTMMALTIATGFVVDDAIVMIENISRYLEEGDSPLQAALKGSGQIAFTIISLTLSLVAVLIPLLFMGDVIGRLFREFSVTLAASILISAAISLTLTPMMCAWLLKAQSHHPTHGLHAWSERLFESTLQGYGRALGWVLDRQRPVLWLALSTLLVTGLLYAIIPKGFFPVQDTGVLQAVTEMRQTVSFDRMASQQQAVSEAIRHDPDVAEVASFVGVDGTNATLNTGRLLIVLKPKAERDDAASVIARLQDRVAALPGVNLYVQPVQDITLDASLSRTLYRLTLQATSPGQLSRWVPAFVGRLKQEAVLKDVTSDWMDQGGQAYITVNRDKASSLGISMAAVDNALYDAFGQRLVSTIFTQTNQYRVVLEADPALRDPSLSLRQIYVPTASGPVSLETFARVEARATPLAINHLGQFPTATVSFNVADGASLSAAVRGIAQARADAGLPDELVLQYQGATLAFQNSLGSTLWLVLAAIITMYIVLGVLYESYIHPVTILSTLPSAGIGALLALLLCGKPLDLIGLIGIILLIGIVKKNAIMMVDFALEAERGQGMAPRDAIYQACLLRLRPILMTTMAALFGALPLLAGNGMGEELRSPLGITLVGGLLFSQVLTLFTTPVIYLFFDRLTLRRPAR